MKKIRVYEYAKKHQLQSKVVIAKLKELNIPVSNHMSTITEDTIKRLDEAFGHQPKQKENGQHKKECASKVVQEWRNKMMRTSIDECLNVFNLLYFNKFLIKIGI